MAASPIICAKSLKRVESFFWLSATLEAYSTTFATASLVRGGSSSCIQYPAINLANLFIFSEVIGASSSNSTLILNNFLKSLSIASKD